MGRAIPVVPPTRFPVGHAAHTAARDEATTAPGPSAPARGLFSTLFRRVTGPPAGVNARTHGTDLRRQTAQEHAALSMAMDALAALPPDRLRDVIRAHLTTRDDIEAAQLHDLANHLSRHANEIERRERGER